MGCAAPSGKLLYVSAVCRAILGQRRPSGTRRLRATVSELAGPTELEQPTRKIPDPNALTERLLRWVVALVVAGLIAHPLFALLGAAKMLSDWVAYVADLGAAATVLVVTFVGVVNALFFPDRFRRFVRRLIKWITAPGRLVRQVARLRREVRTLRAELERAASNGSASPTDGPPTPRTSERPPPPLQMSPPPPPTPSPPKAAQQGGEKVSLLRVIGAIGALVALGTVAIVLASSPPPRPGPTPPQPPTQPPLQSDRFYALTAADVDGPLEAVVERIPSKPQRDACRASFKAAEQNAPLLKRERERTLQVGTCLVVPAACSMSPVWPRTTAACPSAAQ